ncbi:MAG TPA: helix-turn-helix transcriptional regulator [Pseudonocardiaceae bacterium]|jgi:transcriptional regulator with XRE-family HTH domain|nr:helix-turn-helix transcriptional regulator [Pseudonocardiaceae bacterium]
MSGKHRPGTPKDRALGAELRAIREQAGKSLTYVCKAIQWNPSTLSRLERGQRHISPEAVMGLAVVYRLPTDRRDELIARAKEPTALGWWDRPPPGVTSDLGALASYEAEAFRMIDWSPCLLPGLLQTPAYAEAIMHDWGVPEQDVEPRLRARRQRQQLLDRRDVDYHAFIGPAALTSYVCDQLGFVEQLQHVRKLSRRQGICIRLVEAPTSFSVGSWYLMNFEHAGSVVVLEHLGSSTFLFDKETVPYTAARAKLARIALSEQATRDKIDALIEQYTLGS